MATTATSPDGGAGGRAPSGPLPTADEIAAADAATSDELITYRAQIGLGGIRSTAAASRTALGALIRRDAVVLRKDVVIFCLRTVIQPFLLVFVFLYVFPTIGQGVGSSGHGPAAEAAESAFATVLVPGVVAISIMFQGIQAVALQMSQEFGYTREIEDRVQAPCPIWLVAIAKVLSASAQGLLSALLVFPIAYVVHAPGVEAHLSFHWWILVTIIPLACLAMSSLGLLARHHVRAAQHRAHVRVHRAAPHVPRRHLLPVDPARPGSRRRVPLVAGPRAGEPAHLRVRGDAGRPDRLVPHAPVHHLSGAVRVLRPLPHARASQFPQAGPVLRR